MSKIILLIVVVVAGYFYFVKNSKPVFSISEFDKIVSIKDIENFPRKYEGENVSVSGKVISSFYLVGFGIYSLEDSTGHIYIKTDEAVPNEGMKVIVSGVVSQFAKILGKQILVLNENKMELIKK